LSSEKQDVDAQEVCAAIAEHVTLMNLKAVMTHAKAPVQEFAEKPHRIIFSGKPATLTPESEILKNSKPLPTRKQ
jgi:hypothetical protein